MAQFIALLARNRERFSDADFAPLLEPEAEAARTLYAAENVRQMWGRKDVPGAVMLIEADSLAEAQATVERLPLRQQGMLDAQIIELGPYRGFGPRG